MSRRAKFWLLFLFGLSIYVPFTFLAIVVKVHVLAIPFLAGFFLYFCFLYRFVYCGAKPQYPLVPPEGRTDIYLPRTNIPRPIHEDVRRYPESFKRKRRKDSAREEKSRRKK